MSMEWLNYHHLLYFWSVAKHGSVTKACEEFRLAQPTISGQIRLLEQTLGEQLFIRAGRRLVLTEMGHVVFRYAEDIFSTGQELMNAVKGRGANGHHSRLAVGIVDVVAKPLATHFLKSALKLDQPTRLSCREDKLPFLLADLAIHELDLIIADTPAPPNSKAQIYSHLLGESGVTMFATAKLAAQYRRGFPQSLQDAPVLLPTSDAMLRQLLDPWLAHRELSLNIVGEFDDGMTLKAFGQDGYGIFPGATAIEKEICRQYRVQVVGQLDSLKQHFYAITVQRRLTHPAVLAIVQAARRDLLN
ncbi:MAG: transcriptional activator NhaR [Nitrospira sp. ST-bin4]|nr:MAG: transcriptional activator NhaR [Nitrospira sp. ST-bin4]